MDKETKFCLFVMVVIVLGGLLYVVLSVVSKPEPVESTVKCIRSDIGAVVLMDSTQLSNDSVYAYGATYTCQDSTTTSILMFSQWGKWDYFGPWVVVITHTPDYRTEERVFCTRNYSGRELISANRRNGYKEHTSAKYTDSERCDVMQHNLVAEFKHKWKL